MVLSVPPELRHAAGLTLTLIARAATCCRPNPNPNRPSCDMLQVAAQRLAQAEWEYQQRLAAMSFQNTTVLPHHSCGALACRTVSLCSRIAVFSIIGTDITTAASWYCYSWYCYSWYCYSWYWGGPYCPFCGTIEFKHKDCTCGRIRFGKDCTCGGI